MELRPYQTDAVERLRGELRKGKRSLVLQAQVGLGKTVIASEIIGSAKAKGGHILFVAHRRELIRQASEKLTRFQINHSIVMAGHPAPSLYDRVHVGTIQSFTARMRRGAFKPEDVRVIIIDEAHRAAGATYRKLLELYPRAVLLGLTATPTRTDGQGLGDLFEGLVSLMDYTQAVDEGHLVPLRYFVPSTPDLTGVRVKAGEYNEEDLEKRMNTPKLTGDIVDHWLRHSSERLTICFGITVRHSIALRDAFLRKGVQACHIDGETPLEERDQLFKDFQAGRYRVLCNVGIATEGTDVPEVSSIIQAFATKSPIKHIQTIGRASRPFAGKTDAKVFDHGGNVRRLGIVEDYTDWTLEQGKGANDAKKKSAEDEAVKKSAELHCASCSTVFSGTILCPSCGALFDIRKAPMDVLVAPGELAELSPKALKKSVPLERQQEEFAMMLWYAEKKGYSPGWAKHKHRERYGVWPHRVHGVAPIPPDAAVLKHIQYLNIKAAKSRQAAR